MKKMLSAFFLVGGLFAVPLVSPEPVSTVRAQTANLKTVKLTVSGMHCEGCVNRVTRFLKKERGVTACTVNLETGVAEVTFNPARATEKRLIAAVKKAGYKATVQS